MTQVVKDEQGNVLGEFPDDATPEEIEKALSAPAPNEPGAPMVEPPSTNIPWQAAPPEFQVPEVSTEGMPWHESYPLIIGQDMLKGWQKTLGSGRAAIDWWRGHYEPSGDVNTFYNDLGFPQEQETFNFVPNDVPLEEADPALSRLFEPYEKIRRDQAYNALRQSGIVLQDVKPTTGGERIAAAGAEGAGAGLVGGPVGAATGAFGMAAGQTGREAGLPESLNVGMEVVGGMLGPGGVSKLASIPKNLVVAGVPEKLMARAVQIMETHEIDAALQLMRDAERLGGPRRNLTFAEAASQVTNGRTKELLALQRYVEPYSTPLQEAMAERGATNRRMAETQTQAVAGGPLPEGGARAAVPRELGEQAREGVRDVQRSRTMSVSDDYARAMSEPPENVIGPALPEWDAIFQRPGVRDAFQSAARTTANMGNPAYDWIRFYPPTPRFPNGRMRMERIPTPEEIDAMVKDLNAQANAAGNVDAFGKVMPSGVGIQAAARDLENLAESTIPGYREAREHYRRLSGPVTDVEQGPLGAMAEAGGKAEQQLKAQTQALLPDDPLVMDAATAREVVRSLKVRRHNLEGRGPDMAVNEAVGMYLMSRFNKAVGDAGTNASLAGKNWRKAIDGNPDQRAVRQAVIEEAAGPEVAAGFDRMLDVLEAQGYRQGEGSPTNLYQVFRTMFETPKFGIGAEDVAQAGLTGGGSWLVKGVQGVTNKVQEFRHRSRANRIGELLLDPDQAHLWRSLAGMDPSSPNAFRIVNQLLGLGAASATAPREQPPDRRDE